MQRTFYEGSNELLKAVASVGFFFLFDLSLYLFLNFIYSDLV